ncbi:MAG: sigma 54-interacting transcriptional regulator [Candidatus Hodarchaeota archaeon]
MNNLKLESLIELASILEQQSNFEEVLRLVTQKASSMMKAEVVLIMMINPQTRQTVKTIYKEGQEVDNRPYHFVHTNISGWVIDNNCAFLTEDIKTDPRFRKKLFKDIPLKSVMCAPLRAEGVIIGTLLLLNKSDGYTFNKADLSYLEKFVTIVSPFLRNVQKIQQYFVPSLSKATLLKKYEALGLLGKSKKFTDLLQAIESAARCDVRVLLEGQSGTGKELIARAIHQCSSRSQHKFVAIDCGAIPANLIESELFGHVKGAFTGATSARKGLLEEANSGTLFMDEITNLPLELQAKLLRVLQEGEVRPLGSNVTRKVDVRIISASSIPLRNLVGSQQFREDLFYRLHVYPISVPSLDDRRDDIPLLANYFLNKFAQQQKKQAEMFHEEVLDFMKQHKWSGNIRELENFVERMVTLAPQDSKVLNSGILPPEFRNELQKLKKVREMGKITKSLPESLAEYEEKLIRQALIENGWNQSKTAHFLKISEHAMRYKMGKLGIVKPG